MIQLEKVKGLSGRKVKYTSTGRVHLQRASDSGKLTLTGQTSNISNSAQVAFEDRISGKGVEWVGNRFLELASSAHQETIDALTVKRDELQRQIDGLNGAIKHLEEL